jgi:hypothetical protein
MGTKETGSIFVIKCPKCGDELVVGWIRKGDAIPTFDSKAKQSIAPTDINDLASSKQICSCGNARASFDTMRGRCVIDWDTDEPTVGNINLH